MSNEPTPNALTRALHAEMLAVLTAHPDLAPAALHKLHRLTEISLEVHLLNHPEAHLQRARRNGPVTPMGAAMTWPNPGFGGDDDAPNSDSSGGPPTSAETYGTRMTQAILGAVTEAIAHFRKPSLEELLTSIAQADRLGLPETSASLRDALTERLEGRPPTPVLALPAALGGAAPSAEA